MDTSTGSIHSEFVILLLDYTLDRMKIMILYFYLGKIYLNKISKLIFNINSLSTLANRYDKLNQNFREEAAMSNSCFYLRPEKDDNKVILEDKDLEVIGSSGVIQYDDTNVILQHIESGLWFSYKV